jgi:TPP-dependent pyruvate/acetoin dehydrogenase alpha subunit
MIKHLIQLAAAAALVCTGALVVTSAIAGDVYRWTDDEGRAHVSDSVPEKYRERAKRIDVDRSKPTEQQRKDSLNRTKRDKERANAMEQSRTHGAQEAARSAASAASGAPVTKANAKETSCEKAQREFRESQECYAPFRTVNSGVKEEAFKQCGPPVADPSQRCGPAP